MGFFSWERGISELEWVFMELVGADGKYLDLSGGGSLRGGWKILQVGWEFIVGGGC